MKSIIVYDEEERVIDEISTAFDTTDAEVVEALLTAVRDLEPDLSLEDIMRVYLWEV